MDFFERAHVSKKETRKESKTDENVKKQLKQMLEGYRQSDNKLIRNSEKLYTESRKGFDDSSSVSGFSDLNITNSTNEDNLTQELSDYDIEEAVAEFGDDSTKSNDIGQTDNTINSIDSIASVSECKDLLESLSDVSNDSQSDIVDNISLISSLLETATELDSDSQSFDADGALAGKILEQLGKKDNKKKRKLNTEKEKAPNSIKDDSSNYEMSDGSNNDIVSLSNSLTDDVIDRVSVDSNISSPFVSITATEMQSESFNDILGSYKHSTSKNMPTDIQSVLHSTNESNMFSTEDMSVDDIVFTSDKELNFADHYDDKENHDLSIDNDESEIPQEESERESSIEIIDEFVNPIKVYNVKDVYILVLKHPAELYIHGKVNVRTLGGQVEIFGYNLRDQTCKIYAPNYNYAHCLRTVEHQNAYYGLFSKLTTIGLQVHEAEEIVTTIGDYDGIITLSPLKSRQIDFVEDNFTATDLFCKINRNIDNSLRVVSEALGCSLYLNKPRKCFEENPSWKQAVKYGLNERSRGIVCGGKGVGKSTFLRYCINGLLSQGPVLVIDLDPGQAEFTVAGSISATVIKEPLLGPNFTHLRKPDKMLYLGMINTMDNPRRYTTAVTELITHCHTSEQYKKLPWIINTMGMCNAMGLKFITLTILNVKPTYILQIDSKTAKKRFEYYLNPTTVQTMYDEKFQHDSAFRNISNAEEIDYSFYVCHPIESSVKRDFSLAPRDERYLNYLAHFGKLLAARTRKETTLLGITPYEVDIANVYIGMNVKVGRDVSLKVINGKIVALCQLQDNGPRVFTLADKPLLCFGHGLVRGVDYQKGKLYVLTPGTALAAVNALVYADWVPELRGTERALPPARPLAVPYRTAAPYDQRQLMFAPRRRFNPLQLLKMSRNS